MHLDDALVAATLGQILPLTDSAPHALKVSVAAEIQRLATTNYKNQALASFAAFTNSGANLNVALFGDKVFALLRVWLTPDPQTMAHAVTVAKAVLLSVEGITDADADAIAQAVAWILAVHYARGPTPAFTRLCLESISISVKPLTASAACRTKLLASLCLVIGNGRNVPKESLDLANSIIQSLAESKSLKISRASIMNLKWKKNPEITVQARIGSANVFSQLCFVAKPVLDEFSSSNGVRRMIISALVSSSRLGAPEGTLETEAKLHSCLIECIRNWIRADGISLSSTDWEDVIRILDNLKGYIFEHSLQSSQKFEIGPVSATPPSSSAIFSSSKQPLTGVAALSTQIEAIYIEVCSLLHTHFPTLPGAIPQTMYDLFLALITLAPNTVALSEPIMLTTIDYACSSASWLSSSDDPLATNTLQSNISRLIYVYFKSRQTRGTAYSIAQSRIIENTKTLLECGSDYDSGTINSLSTTLMEVLKLVCEKPESFDEALVVEKALASVVVISRGTDDVLFKDLVSLLKQACLLGSGGGGVSKVALGSVKSLINLFRTCVVERDCVGCDVVFDAISEIVADTRGVVAVRSKCLEMLLSLRVEGGLDARVGMRYSLEFSQWLGYEGPIILKSSKLRAQTHNAPGIDSGTPPTKGIVTINLDSHFTSLLKILKLDPSWEIYSLAIHGLHPQLRNLAIVPNLLSAGCVESLRSHFCEVVISEIVAVSITNLPQNVKKSDLYLLVFKFLMTLLLWDHHFSKTQTDDVLKSFLLGLTKWPTPARYCIQALTLLLTELPSPMTRLVPDLLMKVSRLTAASMAPPILEFLSTLARLPEIYVNLTEADYKRIFGIALGNIRAGGGGGGGVLGGYTVQLGYHVLSVWFVNMNVGDRKKYVPFIIGHVLAEGSGSGGGDVSDESVELVMDMLLQNSYVDCAAKPDAFEGVFEVKDGGNGMAAGVGFGTTSLAPTSGSKDQDEKSWIQGNSVLTIRNLKMSGWVEVIVRRPSGTVVFSVKLENRVRFAGNDQGGAVDGGGLPAVVERGVSNVAGSVPEDSSEEAFTRAIKVLDRTPVYDLHKIGVLYIGQGQDHEIPILKNSCGSPAYTRFICALGQLVRLKGLKRFNTGGLDTSEAGVDGTSCIVWQDSASGNQIVFHTTTLMPTMETDPQCSLKKRHVGNDFVSVLFDESGGDAIGFDTLPGQFNFINIIVTPLKGVASDEYENQKFRVVMRVKPELNLPSLGVFSDGGFLVSGESLAGDVRRAAVHANMLALVVAQSRAGGGGFISNARERLRQIKRLGERAKKGVVASAVAGGGVNDVEPLFDFTRFA
ncbi:UNVERIFIED_CONTAM: Tuberous sclerosis 2-like protein [Siphonaria sp. JEL0065]|nr:Tuberous sclerosis 2-like protein [Siphonaria sp. JEL0065]